MPLQCGILVTALKPAVAVLKEGLHEAKHAHAEGLLYAYIPTNWSGADLYGWFVLGLMRLRSASTQLGGLPITSSRPGFQQKVFSLLLDFNIARKVSIFCTERIGC